jgi:hypothetical protein
MVTVKGAPRWIERRYESLNSVFKLDGQRLEGRHGRMK